MPGTYTYPGVYVEEIPSGVRTITGVSTSDTAFVGYFKRGPMNDPVRITSFSDFERKLGGLDSLSEAGYAIQQYYLNGGQIAWVVRVAAGTPVAAEVMLDDSVNSPPLVALTIEANSPGLWGLNLQVAIGHVPGSTDLFNLVVRELGDSGGRTQVINSETHLNLSMDSASSRYVEKVLDNDSELITGVAFELGSPPVPVRPAETGPIGTDITASSVISDISSGDPFEALANPSTSVPASDGDVPDGDALLDGMKTLETISPFVFNILCLPAAANLTDASMLSTYQAAEKFCEDQRAFLIVDIPEKHDTPDDILDKWLPDVGDKMRHQNAAVYFPRFSIADPLDENRPRDVGTSGTMAGIFARTDSNRGVWKAPAGTDADLRGVASLSAKLTDLENGGLNPLGVNVLRVFPIFGDIAWGARTLDGADQQASEWKYIPVRRTALFIEESLFQALKWVVFEPNDEPLWSQIRLNVGAFMQNLFRQGAFQGKTSRDAYLVKCDKETTTQNDIDRGIVNIIVGFAPLKPAEFVIIKIQQLAGQIEA